MLVRSSVIFLALFSLFVFVCTGYKYRLIVVETHGKFDRKIRHILVEKEERIKKEGEMIRCWKSVRKMKLKKKNIK